MQGQFAGEDSGEEMTGEGGVGRKAQGRKDNIHTHTHHQRTEVPERTRFCKHGVRASLPFSLLPTLSLRPQKKKKEKGGERESISHGQDSNRSA